MKLANVVCGTFDIVFEGQFRTRFSAPCHPRTRRVMCATDLVPHAHRMLIGACNPTLRPIHVFSQYLPLPVVGGYLAFIGIFCLEAGLSLMTGQQIDGVSTWGLLFKSWCGCHPQNLASSCSARANMSPGGDVGTRHTQVHSVFASSAVRLSPMSPTVQFYYD